MHLMTAKIAIYGLDYSNAYNHLLVNPTSPLLTCRCDDFGSLSGTARKRRLAMEFPMSLSMEQQFKLQVYKDQVKELTPEQSQAYLVEVMRQLMVKENLIKHLVKQAA